MRDLRATPRESVVEIFKATMQFDPKPALATYRGPALVVITPSNDFPFSIQRLKGGPPHRVVEGTGHWIQLDKPAEVSRILDQFLETEKGERRREKGNQSLFRSFSLLLSPFSMAMFAHLHVHTHFSFGIGASSPETLAEAAAKREFRALACTDTNGVYGAIEFQRACEAAGVRPILGAHLVTDDEETVALAADERGWAALCRAITRIHWKDGKGGEDGEEVLRTSWRTTATDSSSSRPTPPS